MPIKTLVVWLVFSFFSCTVVGQSTHAFVEKFQNTPLEQAFDILAKKHKLKFSYENLAVANIRVSKKINAKDISGALTQLLAGLELEYHITGTGQILVRKALSESELSVSEVKIKVPRKVNGVLIDAWTQQPLAYGHVLCGQGDGVISDENGRFEINLEDGSATTEVAVQYLGYQMRKTWITPGTEPLDLKIKLTPKVEQLQGMTVTARLPTMSNKVLEDATVLHGPALQRLPAFVNGADVMRSLQYLPGVSAHDDLSADLNIRGGSGDENLIILDGITLYNVTHYFGIFSIVNPHVVDEVKVYKNAFPAEYGGRTSAVVDIRSAQRSQGNTEALAIADVNLMTSSVLLDVPLGKQFRVMAAGRITNQNLANSKLFNLLNSEVKDTRIFDTRPGFTKVREVVSQKPELRFFDANFKASWRPSARFSADFNYFSGADKYAYAYSRTSTQTINNRREILNESYDEEADWFNQGFGLQLNQRWSTRLSSNVNIAFSEYGISRDFSQKSIFQIGNRLRPNFVFSNKHDNHISGLDLNWKNEWQLNASQRLVFGFESIENKSTLYLKDGKTASLDLDDHGTQQSLYGEYQADLADSTLNLSFGLRGTRYNGNNFFSPRLGLFVKASDELRLKASWSIYQQFLYQFFHEDIYGRSYPYWVLAKGDPRFPVTVAHNTMLGANFRKGSFELDAEFYVKNTNNMVEHARTLVALPDSFEYKFTTFQGKGKTIGLDLLLKKSFPHYDTWVAYTLSKSSQSFANIARGQWFASPNDRRHQLKWINQYNWKKFDFSLVYVFASGRPYTDLSKLSEKPVDRGVTTPENRLSYLEDYHRVDFATTYSFHIGKTNVQANLSFFNLFNHQNVKYRQYIYSFVPADPRTGQTKPQNTVQGLGLQSLDFTTSVGVVVRF
jgi:hypothetical protein